MTRQCSVTQRLFGVCSQGIEAVIVSLLASPVPWPSAAAAPWWSRGSADRLKRPHRHPPGVIGWLPSPLLVPAVSCVECLSFLYKLFRWLHLAPLEFEVIGCMKQDAWINVVPLIMVPLIIIRACEWLVHSGLWIATSQSNYVHCGGGMEHVLEALWWPFIVCVTHPQQLDSLL